MDISINAEQRLFVIPCGSGFSCLGFDVAYKRLAQYAQKLGLPAPSSEEIGTSKQYKAYLEAESRYIATNPQETFFDADTPTAVQEVLERYRNNGREIRIFLGNREDGRDWLETYDTIGRVGRSMGPIKVPLLVKPRASGGGAILTSSIVRIVGVASKLELYRHPTYHLPVLAFRVGEDRKYPVEVLGNDKVLARFATDKQAQRWVDFLTCRRIRR